MRWLAQEEGARLDRVAAYQWGEGLLEQWHHHTNRDKGLDLFSMGSWWKDCSDAEWDGLRRAAADLVLRKDLVYCGGQGVWPEYHDGYSPWEFKAYTARAADTLMPMEQPREPRGYTMARMEEELREEGVRVLVGPGRREIVVRAERLWENAVWGCFPAS